MKTRGRPPLPPGERMVKTTITVPEPLLLQLAAAGNGNVSKGVRKLGERYRRYLNKKETEQ